MWLALSVTGGGLWVMKNKVKRTKKKRTETQRTMGCDWIHALYPSLMKLRPLTMAVTASCSVRMV